MKIMSLCNQVFFPGYINSRSYVGFLKRRMKWNIKKLVVEFEAVFAVALVAVLIVTFSGTSSSTEKAP